MSERPPPTEGRLLFRFKPPEMTKRQIGMTDVCVEYAVTALTEDEIASSECLVPHNGVVIYGWIERINDWHTNVSARPVVFELLKRWRDVSTDLEMEGVETEKSAYRLRLPGEPEDETE